MAHLVCLQCPVSGFATDYRPNVVISIKLLAQGGKADFKRVRMSQTDSCVNEKKVIF